MDYDRSRSYDHDDENGMGRPKRKTFTRRKACRFCGDKEFKADYKNPKLLSSFLSERGRIIPRRILGTCALHQRSLTTSIKRARAMALLPYTSTQR